MHAPLQARATPGLWGSAAPRGARFVTGCQPATCQLPLRACGQ